MKCLLEQLFQIIKSTIQFSLLRTKCSQFLLPFFTKLNFLWSSNHLPCSSLKLFQIAWIIIKEYPELETWLEVSPTQDEMEELLPIITDIFFSSCSLMTNLNKKFSSGKSEMISAMTWMKCFHLWHCYHGDKIYLTQRTLVMPERS